MGMYCIGLQQIQIELFIKISIWFVYISSLTGWLEPGLIIKIN